MDSTTDNGGTPRRRRAQGAAARDDAERIIDAALALMAGEGWRRLSLAAIAGEAGMPMLQVYRRFASKQAILCDFLRRIDETVLADPPAAESDERPRDRLFDLLMRRFDALRPYRAALEALRRDLTGDPVSALALAASLSRSLRWMLETAGIPTVGLHGMLAVKLTGAAYLGAMRVWRHDDSADLAATMAALDARLRRIERWLAGSAPLRRGDAVVAG